MLELRSVPLKPDAAPVSALFESGKINVVLGRNHSGKTRLARIVAGLDRPSAGELTLDGRPITDEPPGKRPVALVYQAFVNYPNWTVFENIASPLVAARREAEEIRHRVEAIAARLQLEALLDRLPGELSGGQQQRVAIGRALAKSADVLVMDEPLVNLDYKLREALQLELRELLGDLKLTVLYTTTDPRDAFALGDALFLLLDHELIQSGTPLSVYEAPASRAAADLMSDPCTNAWREDGATRLVRPEHLYLEPERDDDVAFEVRVMGRETNGSETLLHCRLEGKGMGDWVARLAGLVDAAPDSRLKLYAAADAILPVEPQEHRADG